MNGRIRGRTTIKYTHVYLISLRVSAVTGHGYSKLTWDMVEKIRHRRERMEITGIIASI